MIIMVMITMIMMMMMMMTLLLTQRRNFAPSLPAGSLLHSWKRLHHDVHDTDHDDRDGDDDQDHDHARDDEDDGDNKMGVTQHWRVFMEKMA